MKKFLSISALVVAISSVGFISYGAASRYRPTTDRLFAHSYRKTLLRRVKKSPVTEMDKFRFWYNFEQQKKRTYDRRAYADWRSAHNVLFPRDENLHTTKKIVVRKNNSNKILLAHGLPTVFNNGWDFELEGVEFKIPDNVLRNTYGQYEDNQTDLVFEINKFEKGCSSLGFQMCAVQRTKHLRARRNLKAISNVKRAFSLRRVVIEGRFVYVPQFVESFDVTDFGVERTYSIYTIQNPVTAEVIYIEGWSSVKNFKRARNILKAVARTIRFN